jgi:hypothetical protein
MQRPLTGRAQVQTGQPHERINLMSEHAEDERLTVARRRDRAGPVIGPSAGANEWSVPDPANELASAASGRGRRREVSLDVQGDGTHRLAHHLGFRSVAAPDPAQLLLPASGHKPASRYQRQAFPTGKFQRSRSAEHYMWRPVHHRPRRTHRIANTTYTGHGSSAARCPISHRRVMFHTATSRQDSTPAGIELLIVLKNHDGSNHRIQRRPTVAQHRHACHQALAQPVAGRSNSLRVEFLRHDVTSTAMHRQDRRDGRPHRGDTRV